MTTRSELDALLGAYDNYIGTGNMKQAGRTLPKIIRALVTFVEERTPDHVEPEIVPAAPVVVGKIIEEAFGGVERRTFMVDVGDTPPEKVKEVLEAAKAEFFAEGATCPPCDVSIPNNPDLIDEFKTPVVETADAVVEAAEVDGPEEETKADEAAAAEAVETSPVTETIAPAPKTPKKPKATT